MRTKLTQREAIFYTLYRALKEKPHEFIPVFKFMGEVYCPKLNVWGFVSHECSARASEMRKDMPTLIQSVEIIGKSGARYFGYRLNPNAQPWMIEDRAMLRFYEEIKDV